MAIRRKPFQGVFNIIRFNWHFYVAAGALIIALAFFSKRLPELGQTLIWWFIGLSVLSVAVSLIVSFFIYDLSDIYELNWIPARGHSRILNINAGFDETSVLIKSKNPAADLVVCDFYDPKKHTEVSIKRARKAYPPYENTVTISTAQIPFEGRSFDCVVAFLSAHEIRSHNERVIFFRELYRVTKAGGQVFVTEHLRDFNNFLAYTVGAFHFHSRREWLETFEQAGWTVKDERRSSPIITTFILDRNGDPS